MKVGDPDELAMKAVASLSENWQVT